MTDFANAPKCNVCDRPMILGQKDRHFVCSPPSECCDYPIDLIHDPIKHAQQHAEQLAPPA